MTVGTKIREGSVATFPSNGVRQQFLDRVSLWSKVEGLPKIEAEPLHDGYRVRLWSADAGQGGLGRLVHACGGRLAINSPVSPAP